MNKLINLSIILGAFAFILLDFMLFLKVLVILFLTIVVLCLIFGG